MRRDYRREVRLTPATTTTLFCHSLAAPNLETYHVQCHLQRNIKGPPVSRIAHSFPYCPLLPTHRQLLDFSATRPVAIIVVDMAYRQQSRQDFQSSFVAGTKPPHNSRWVRTSSKSSPIS